MKHKIKKLIIDFFNTIIEGWKEIFVRNYVWKYSSSWSEEEIIRRLKCQDNGAIQFITKMKDGEIIATFNIFPYKPERITKEQFQRYKRFLTKIENYSDLILETWSLTQNTRKAGRNRKLEKDIEIMGIN